MQKMYLILNFIKKFTKYKKNILGNFETSNFFNDKNTLFSFDIQQIEKFLKKENIISKVTCNETGSL